MQEDAQTKHRHYGLLDLLEDGDSLMTDKGFDIADDLEKEEKHYIVLCDKVTLFVSVGHATNTCGILSHKMVL